jgi:hypothetical protein
MSPVHKVMRALNTQSPFSLGVVEAEAMARAAIEAMREPSEGMLDAARNGYADDGAPLNMSEYDLRNAYQIMIDAALKGDEA